MSKEHLSIVDAIENLTALLEADSLEEIEITERAQIIAHKASAEVAGLEYWVHAGYDEQTLMALKETFSVIYDYLHDSYKKMHAEGGETPRQIEGIHTIMVLVGEATQKFDRFGKIFHDQVLKSKEYQKLEHFCHQHISKEVHPHLGSSFVSFDEEKPLPQGEHGIHLLNDLDVVKKDQDYELFYLRTPEGKPFYTQTLARNIKLACDFGVDEVVDNEQDPLLRVKDIEDKSLQVLAADILQRAKPLIERFYKRALKFKGVNSIALLHQALMALMLASYPKNLLRQFAQKGCHAYFQDFYTLLRQILQNKDLQDTTLYSSESHPFFLNAQELVDLLSTSLFTLNKERQELEDLFEKIFPTLPQQGQLHLFLAQRYKALEDILKRHPSGPIFKALDVLRENIAPAFDPLFQGNLPTAEGRVSHQLGELTLSRMPAPLTQEWIERPEIAPEFLGYLRYLVAHKEKFLAINLQDRTSWNGHNRSLILEELQQNAEYADVLVLVTLAKETDFYRQEGPYAEFNRVPEFFEQFQLQLQDELSGYFFPPHLKKSLSLEWMEMLESVHRNFFESKNSLTWKARRAFIDLMHLSIIVKIIELITPKSVAFLSKDGLDLGTCEVVELLLFLHHPQREWSGEEMRRFSTILFGQTLLVRERNVQKEWFERCLQAIKYLELSLQKLKSSH